MRASLLATSLGCAALVYTMAAPASADASWLSQALRGGGHYHGGGYGGYRAYYGGHGHGYHGGYRAQPYYVAPYYGHGGYDGYRPYSSYYAAPYSSYRYAPGYYSNGYYCR